MHNVILETPRLRLREMTWDDLDFVAAMLGDPNVMRHYPQVHTRGEAELWLKKMVERYRDDGHALWLVSLRAEGQPIGQVGLLRQHVDGVDEPEIGYLVHAPYWRQGYAFEAASAVRDFAFATLHKSRVISLIRPGNIPSQRVALRLGMKPERLTKFRDFDTLVFSLARPIREPQA
jgi:RimJ/RimL family protein N-acetyltransferase